MLAPFARPKKAATAKAIAKDKKLRGSMKAASSKLNLEFPTLDYTLSRPGVKPIVRGAKIFASVSFTTEKASIIIVPIP